MNELEKFTGVSVMIIGDLIMDQFIYGQPSRISREAPVLILDETDRRIKPGGAGNAAVNVSSLGGDAHLVSPTGNDNSWRRLAGVLEEYDISTDGVEVSDSISSAVKTRIMAGSDQIVRQQVVRVDSLEADLVSDDHRRAIEEYVKSMISKVDAVIFSDYGLGLFSEDLIGRLLEICRKSSTPSITDSRYQLLKFSGTTIATPNLEEAGRAVGFEPKSDAEVLQVGRQILSQLKSEYLLITRGRDGMTLFYSEDDYEHIPVSNKLDVYDVTGAGDTVAAAVAVGMGADMAVGRAVRLANKAAGVAVKKEGAAPVYLDELKEVV
ncbi:bifunctional heptose 7-phosphate kinase/heptose 1-phosphate adenyltransferase [Halarsenatibacter silvermanii]|uniref:RfaE bifunctional protein, domain I n=1 Tax=Halarsenatibacter silvermanii TaxID=321763 RepID=A0A1G9MLB7_9FIRM|nr:bifunctional ADP-heptose synthase [Halarsenatibacter silvermanii]SDL75058.1 rfaE bifunctional protein, domain I [Halarsenatibacter silvermanii]